MTVHVYPVSDDVAHDTDHGEAVYRDDGSNGWLITHHSLDGRENNGPVNSQPPRVG